VASWPRGVGSWFDRLAALEIAVVVVHEFEDGLLVAEREEVVGCLELAVPDDVEVPREPEAECPWKLRMRCGSVIRYIVCRNVGMARSYARERRRSARYSASENATMSSARMA
jgi:hypothetical protein